MIKAACRTLFGLGVIALLSACAGTNFKRPDSGALVIGKSTSADIARVMGPPEQVGEALKNEQKIKIARYAYAEGAGTGRHPGVVPARVMVFSTFNDMLVGEEFQSSFPDDATEFDESKVTDIVQGKSTREEVLKLLGRPNGQAIYPLIKKKDEAAFVYSYSHARGSVFDMKFYSKVLVVSFRPDGVVSDVEFVTSGTK